LSGKKNSVVPRLTDPTFITMYKNMVIATYLQTQLVHIYQFTCPRPIKLLPLIYQCFQVVFTVTVSTKQLIHFSSCKRAIFPFPPI